MLNANNRKEEKEEKEDSLFPFSSSPENGFAARERVTARPFFISLRATRPLIPFPPPPIQPFSSHSISSPQPSLPFLCPSALSAHKGRKKEGMGKERMGGSVAKAAAAAAALLFSSSESPFFSVRLSAFLAFLLARSNRSGRRRLVLPRSSPEWKLVI